MAMNKIYGIDPDKQTLTPEEVKSALLECFTEAHCADTGLDGDVSSDKSYCEMILRKAFSETGGDYEIPTKDSIVSVVQYLAEFSKNFRDPTVIQKHQAEIELLISKL